MRRLQFILPSVAKEKKREREDRAVRDRQAERDREAKRERAEIETGRERRAHSHT